jgi:adenosylhomocysteine nucleosidase
VIAVSFALPEESRDFIRAISGAVRSGSPALPVVSGTIGGRAVTVVHSGMGMASASAQIESFLKDHAPAAWIAAGFGGALCPELRIGDIVAVENFSNPALLEAARALPARAGNLITTKQVVETAEQKKDLARHTGAIVVDMETAAVSRLCESRAIPLLGVRAVSDVAGQDLPVPTAVWFDLARQRPRPARLVAYLAMHPARIPPFARFVRGIGAARVQLTAFLLELIEKLPPDCESRPCSPRLKKTPE